MRTAAKTAILVGSVLGVVWLAGTAARAQTEATFGYGDEYGDDYRQGDFGRVRSAEDGVTIRRAEWEQAPGGSEPGGVNSPIFPGDSIATEPGQRVEVQLSGGALVWIDHATELTFLALPDPYAEFPDNTVIQLANGRLRLASSLSREEEFRVDTPASTIYPLGDGELRIEVDPSGYTRVVSRRGVAEVVGSGGSVILRGGMSTEVYAGALPADAQPVNTFAGDAFDRWVEQREAQYEYRAEGGRDAYDALPYEVKPYYPELSAHGTWVYADTYGYVWQPAGVGVDWRPYHDGYWNYGPHGYFWVSHEPWGWAPYHYGRWTWIAGYGWCWSAGSVFGGAWVAWSWGPAYVGWSPLSYWNYPAYRYSLHYGYYDPYCWTFVGYQHFHHHNYAHYAVPYDHVEHGVHHAAVVTRPPRVSPRGLAESTEARERALREVRQDRHARIAPADERRAGSRSFRATEARLARSAPEDRNRPDLAGRGAAPRPAPPRAGAATGSRAERGATPRDRLPVVTTPRYPRRLSTGAASRGSPARPDGRPEASRPIRQRQAEPLGTSERLRDIYRKMAQPRQTRERPVKSRPPAQSGAKQPPQPKQRGGGAKARPAPSSRPQNKPSKPRSTPRKSGRNDQAELWKPAGSAVEGSASRGRGGIVRSTRVASSTERRSVSVAANPRPPSTRHSTAARSKPSPGRPPGKLTARPKASPSRIRTPASRRSGGGSAKPEVHSGSMRSAAPHVKAASRQGGGGPGQRKASRSTGSRKPSGAPRNRGGRRR